MLLRGVRIERNGNGAPAGRFDESVRRGQIATGMDGDIVALGSDPTQMSRAFADVRYTIKAGRAVFQR